MSQQWTPPPSTGGTTTVPNYLIPAIISAFCCMPLGVVAIVFAAQVNNKVAAGDIAGAMDSSKKAKMFSFIALGLGLLAGLIYVVWIVLIVGLSAAGNM
jgi:hypothetical protein